MFGLRKKKTVKIQFFEDSESEPFASTEMPFEQIPEVFEIGSTMSISDDEWSIICVEPPLRSEIIATGALDLRLSKVVMINPAETSYSQADITEKVDDNIGLSIDDWIETLPLNSGLEDPVKQGLPPKGASRDEVFRIASGLSSLRETISDKDDGVYCPLCHIANIDLGRLRSPCPRCSSPLLQFGWS